MMLEQVHHDADRVTRLVTELLDISRLETGRLVLRRQMVDLAGAGRDRWSRRWRMSYPELDCTVAFPADFPRVYADPDKVEQVLTNLVENAAKYGSPKAMRVAGEVDDGDGGGGGRRHGRGHPRRRTCPGCSPSSSGATTAGPPAPASGSGSAGAWSRPTAGG